MTELVAFKMKKMLLKFVRLHLFVMLLIKQMVLTRTGCQDYSKGYSTL